MILKPNKNAKKQPETTPPAEGQSPLDGKLYPYQNDLYFSFSFQILIIIIFFNSAYIYGLFSGLV